MRAANPTPCVPVAIQRLDDRLERLAAAHRNGRAGDAAHLLSAAADRAKLWVALSLLRWRRDPRSGRRAAIRCIVAVFGVTALMDLFKHGVGRPRPATRLQLRFGVRPQTSASFPSGHAVSAALAATLLSEEMPGWAAPLTLLALAVGSSRVQVGLHHASDVAGGLVIGAIAGRLIRRVWRLQ